MKGSKFFESACGFFAVMFYLFSAWAAFNEQYERACWDVLVAIFFTLLENQVHQRIREDRDDNLGPLPSRWRA